MIIDSFILVYYTKNHICSKTRSIRCGFAGNCINKRYFIWHNISYLFKQVVFETSSGYPSLDQLWPELIYFYIYDLNVRYKNKISSSFFMRFTTCWKIIWTPSFISWYTLLLYMMKVPMFCVWRGVSLQILPIVITCDSFVLVNRTKSTRMRVTQWPRLKWFG